MIKKSFAALLLLLFAQKISGQQTSAFVDSITLYFSEVKTKCSEYKSLWNKDLYGPLLLADPETRQIFANFPDSTGSLIAAREIYSGTLPKDINIANTALHWKGRRWAMIVLPLPPGKAERIDLLAHELFHTSQPSLGFYLHTPDNNHLDQKDGRIYLRLELEALKKALQTSNEADRKMHLTNALSFKKYRQWLYAGADTTENLLELNEGLAEYAGLIISGRDKRQIPKYLQQSMNIFLSNPTFVRSFAYQTVPVYGYLLRENNQQWNKDINGKSNLSDYFIKAFNIMLPVNLKRATDSVSPRYNGSGIVLEEAEREERNKKLTILYKDKFVIQPHLEIRFEHVNISFDPRNLMPLENLGTIYPNIRVSDRWGVLTVDNGALVSPNWGKISLTPPTKTNNKIISGDGWTLDLKAGYTLVKDENTGNYQLTTE